MASPTPPKTMSSRLLGMKFMQRVAASPSPSPTTPKADEHSSKRRKLSRENSDSLVQVDQAAIQAAVAEEERKRQGALARRAAELGDSRWVLDMPEMGKTASHQVQAPLNVIQVGFAQIDASGAAGLDSESTDAYQGPIPPFRRYNMDKKQAGVPKGNKSDSDESGSDSDSDSKSSSDEFGSGRQLYGQGPERRSDSSRTALQDKKNAERIKAMQFAEKRRKKEVKLNHTKASSASAPKQLSISSGGGLSSISSGGNSSRQPMDFTCHRCGKPGHKAVDCKNQNKRMAH
ncbi:hypothetical protein F5B20DRAFT_582338 [Whalleya microplaca]|nr:hypothetical protein F5B20DRAFT_582338 [Whalleya microplaca]